MLSSQATHISPYPALTLHDLLVRNVVDYAIFMLDTNGIVTSWNAGAERIIGYPAQEILGRHFSAFYLEEDCAHSVPAQALDVVRHCGRYESESWRVRKDGTRFWAGVVIDAIHDDGVLVGFAKVTRDLTERREAQRALEKSRDQLSQAQKMESLGQLTGGMAHEFNNLLGGITGSLEMLQRRVEQRRLDCLDRYISSALMAATRAAALTQRLLAFGQRQTLDIRPVHPQLLINGMLESVRGTMGPAVEVVAALPEDAAPILCDRAQLETAILNLGLNARDAMPDGGRLTIEVDNHVLDEATAQAHGVVAGRYARINVSDTGHGMAPEVARQAFEPFFTTKPLGQGTGLGLSMVFGFARQSGGYAEIDSAPGIGTTVHIWLPSGDAGAQPSPIARGANGASGHETILIIDDEPIIRVLLTEALSDMGYATLQAADGAAGLQVLQSGVSIDLLVTDIGLPGGLNGRQVADAARRAKPALKVLFITGYAEKAVFGQRPLDTGMHVLTKPFALDALGRLVRAIIAEA